MIDDRSAHYQGIVILGFITSFGIGLISAMWIPWYTAIGVGCISVVPVCMIIEWASGP